MEEDKHFLSDILKKELGYSSVNIIKIEYPVENILLGKEIKKVKAVFRDFHNNEKNCELLLDKDNKILNHECKDNKKSKTE